MNTAAKGRVRASARATSRAAPSGGVTSRRTASGQVRRGKPGPRPQRGKVAATGRLSAESGMLQETAARSTLAVNPLIGLRRRDILDAAATLLSGVVRHPRSLSAQGVNLAREIVRVAIGRSTLAADAGDRRFADPAWAENRALQRLLQAYLALGKSLGGLVEGAQLKGINAERARFVASLLLDAIAPTNLLVTNPAALRKLARTRGASVIRGLANLVEDVTTGNGLPRQVDSRPFVVGKNLATTPGAVVFRNEMLELIQYAPTTPEVHARPLLIVPPQINKFYVFDLAPSKSIVQWTLASGLQTFAISWRNPKREHADWGLDEYVGALEQAVDVVRAISASDDINVWGACSGGITLTALLGYFGSGRDRRVKSATLPVCVLDTSAVRSTTAGLFVTPATVAAARRMSRKRGVLEGAELARMFAWMRPNDLIWNYVVNNYLLGNEPPAYDILYWNNDTTRLPAKLHSDFLDLFEANPFAKPGALRVRGRTIDVAAARLDTYVVGGLTDHITPWQGVYRTARLYGGARSTFVLANNGHIQSLINPPGNTKAWFVAAPARAADAEAWVKGKERTAGSWWPHWRHWIQQRAGTLKPAPAQLGGAGHVSLAPAPGTYVTER